MPTTCVTTDYHGHTDVTFEEGEGSLIPANAGDLTMSGNLRVGGTAAPTAPISLTGVSADPSAPGNGDLWYNSTSNVFKFRENGATTVSLGGDVGDVGDCTGGACLPTDGSTHTIGLKDTLIFESSR